MRQVFTSPRLENVERVAALLREHGIETRITNGRTFRGSLHGNFSYRESANTRPQPAVWVVKSEDQPAARQLLRDAGLLDSGRSPTSYLSTDLLHGPRDDAGDPAKRRVFRIKAGLMISIVVAIGLGLLAWRKSTVADASTTAAAPRAPTPRAAAPLTMHVPGDGASGDGATYVVAVPSALAAMLVTAELRAREHADVCLSVDGADPSETVMAQFGAGDRARVRARSACAAAAGNAPALSIDVREYRTDGSGSGTVRLEIAKAGDRAQAEGRTLEVRRDGLAWDVKRVVP